ncbi:ClpP/crotonase-like domain-containing protein [Fennellomyces sp. T-0311]|nr:ClpP/crotonase-like domain-containing protein [Fennellomyces sp. T-0311]
MMHLKNPPTARTQRTSIDTTHRSPKISYAAIASQRLQAVKNSLAASPAPSKTKSINGRSLIIPDHQSDNGTEEVLIEERPNGFFEICLNRPTKLNAINFKMADLISQKLLAWETSEKCKFFLFKGTGARAFCAGGDIRDLVDLELAGQHDVCVELFRKHCRLNHVVASRNKPGIAIINGITMGGGVGLSVNLPFCIATENTIFAMPECSIGHHPDASSSFWFPRLDGYLGLYLGLTGQRVRAQDVFYTGIASHYVPANRLDDLEAALGDLASKSIGELDYNSINTVIEQFSADMDQVPPFSFGGDICRAINRCFQYKTMEEIVSALNNEKVAVQWAKETLGQLEEMSPTSLKLFLQLYYAGSLLSFADCMKLEYQLTNRTLDGREFKEGTQATLITRTKPKWDPPTLQQVNAEEIKRYYFDTPISNPLTFLCEGAEYKERPHTRFRLPKCTEILEAAEMLDRNESTKYFLNKYQGKQGVKAKVFSVLNG